MAALTKNAISVTVRDRAKRTKIWDHKGYLSQITITMFRSVKMAAFQFVVISASYCFLILNKKTL